MYAVGVCSNVNIITLSSIRWNVEIIWSHLKAKHYPCLGIDLNPYFDKTSFVMPATVYPKKYAHGFVVLCFVVVMQSFIMNSHEVFIHIHQGCFAGTGAIVRLPPCQWSKPDGYGKISQCITTTKHSKAKTVCIYLGIYCTSRLIIDQQGTPTVISNEKFSKLYQGGEGELWVAVGCGDMWRRRRALHILEFGMEVYGAGLKGWGVGWGLVEVGVWDSARRVRVRGGGGGGGGGQVAQYY